MEYRLDAQFLATLVVARSDVDRSDDPAAFASEQIARGERAPLNAAREELDRSGAEVPHYRVGDDGLTDHMEALATALRTKFGID